MGEGEGGGGQASASDLSRLVLGEDGLEGDWTICFTSTIEV